LKRAGYPFGVNDLTVEEWDDLGSIERVMRAREDADRMTALQQLLVKIFRK